jgi:hypothetical protein
MKTVDKLSVLTIASVMLDQQSEITTLEVKNTLRTHGYFAEQSKVSTLMSDVAKEQGWGFKDNGKYRSYHLNPSPSAHTTISVTSIHGTVLPGKKVGAWEVNSVTNSNIVYIDGSQTRDQVRKIYKQMHNVKWEDTRARKVK